MLTNADLARIEAAARANQEQAARMGWTEGVFVPLPAATVLVLVRMARSGQHTPAGGETPLIAWFDDPKPRNRLQSYGITSMEQLRATPDATILAIRNIGHVTLAAIRAVQRQWERATETEAIDMARKGQP